MEKDPNTFLSKKRKNIFLIKKLEKTKDKNSHPRNSLIEISKLVLDYIKEKEQKTGNQITEFIINTLQPEKNEELFHKNIQRRIYDSINVMNSIGLIKKNKQNIKYIPIKEDNNEKYNKISNLNEKCFKMNNSEKNKDELNLKKAEYLEKLKELKLLRKVLIQKYLTLKYYEELSKSNNINHIVFFPNHLQITKDNNKLFSFIKNEDVEQKLSSLDNSTKNIKKKISQEILAKLNENIYKKQINKVKNISNKLKKKKNKSDIFNDMKDEKFSKINNINDIKINEDIVFNYLKKLKEFKNELTLYTK